MWSPGSLSLKMEKGAEEPPTCASKEGVDGRKSPEELAVYHARLKVLKVGGIGDGGARCKSAPKVRVWAVALTTACKMLFFFSSLCQLRWDFFCLCATISLA